ncbi:RNA ligase, partial [Bacillus pumilus]|uniref:RNA ligase n=1 Tax=Bacillus pumilus TaxID=1408 RepID=UPI003703CBD8
MNLNPTALFLNILSNHIVSRSYNKFFNIHQPPETKIHHLLNHLQFPLTVYHKPNPYLPTLPYNQIQHQFLFTSKSYTSHLNQNHHPSSLQHLFYQTFPHLHVHYIKSYLPHHNLSLLFQLIFPHKHPHIITYQHHQLIFLHILNPQLTYQKPP